MYKYTTVTTLQWTKLYAYLLICKFISRQFTALFMQSSILFHVSNNEMHRIAPIWNKKKTMAGSQWTWDSHLKSLLICKENLRNNNKLENGGRLCSHRDGYFPYTILHVDQNH